MSTTNAAAPREGKKREARRTVAGEIERSLALEILRGERGADTQLPSVRELARSFGVTAPTIQRVIDRLASTGLVTVRRGSGVRVNDAHACGDLSLLPLWFEALADDPRRAGKILGDFLELRRGVAVLLVRTRAGAIKEAAPRLAALAAELVSAESLTDLVRIDLAFTRAVIDAADQFAVASISHITERLVREVPFVAEALYEDRTYYRNMAARLVGALSPGDPDATAMAMDEVLAEWDARTVRRFRRRLSTSRR